MKLEQLILLGLTGVALLMMFAKAQQSTEAQNSTTITSGPSYTPIQSGDGFEFNAIKALYDVAVVMLGIFLCGVLTAGTVCAIGCCLFVLCYCGLFCNDVLTRESGSTGFGSYGHGEQIWRSPFKG
ncbi:MAG: hypothetical protein JSS53_03840 [Proteobacteria bacterium]|nr:hypothetical protein [Pseudomonadota bacterium]